MRRDFHHKFVSDRNYLLIPILNFGFWIHNLYHQTVPEISNNTTDTNLLSQIDELLGEHTF
ncbi:MAG: hypothetical protein NHB32_11565 [Fischerella sp. CENA71]|nr:hypothetical protein [Fischerella sp. CENA71]